MSQQSAASNRQPATGNQQPETGNRQPETGDEKLRPPSPMEFGSMPLDPVYGWGLVFEPVETLIGETAAYIEQLAREVYERGEEFSDQELEERFLSFWERLVEEGKLRRLPDRPPEFGRAILGPRRWLRAQRIRIRRLVEHWKSQTQNPT